MEIKYNIQLRAYWQFYHWKYLYYVSTKVTGFLKIFNYYPFSCEQYTLNQCHDFEPLTISKNMFSLSFKEAKISLI